MTTEELERLPHSLLDRLIDTALYGMYDAKDALDLDPQNEELRRKYLRTRDWLITCQDARRKPRPAILRIKIDRVFDEKHLERT